MFLKSVEIFGFKSFADRSKIEFTDGISALLGPNGCGKSNVVDSIKWVLGEQSTRMLRAEKMEDIIFNGTEGRKALNVAEVTLTLSNDGGILPMEVPEISIKRRLYRSGESEYFINNTPVKLKELKELFFDTGIGKSSYSVMEQGKIDQILSSKPEERRYLFEEAAGITRYKQKGAEAERKLQRTEENMRQVESIISEVKRTYETLKKQSEKTALYRDYREKIFNLELDQQLLKLKSFLEAVEKKEEKLNQTIAKRDLLKEKIDSINEALEENLDVVNSMESKLIENQKRIYGIEIEKSNHDNRIEMIHERSGELKKQIETDTVRENATREKISQLKELVSEKEKILKDYESRLKEIDKNIREFTASIETAENRIVENGNIIQSHEMKIDNLQATREDIRNKLQSITDNIVNELDQRLKDTGYSYSNRKETEESITQLLDKISRKIQGKVHLLDDMIATGASDTVDSSATLKKMKEGLLEVFSNVEMLTVKIDDFKQVIPSFIDEFLAPEGIITKKREFDEALEKLKQEILERKEKITILEQENSDLNKRINGYRNTLQELHINQATITTRRNTTSESINAAEKNIQEQKRELENITSSIATHKTRIREIEKTILTIQNEHGELVKQEKLLKKELQKLESGISSRNKDLMTKEKSLKSQMEDLGRTQNSVELLKMELSALNTEVKNLYDNFFEIHARDLKEFESRVFDIKESSKQIREKLSGVKDKLRSLGHVNLMAAEEFAEIKERYEFLTGQLEDLYKAREDLTRVTKQIREESTERFLDTYNKIKKNFHSMYRRLFGGGRAEIRLSDPDAVLTSGIEFYAQPPGKKLENIALLSGGERSLTAVALLFATYMVKPSPFCILDEIDAALDEANINRFVTLLMEFGEKTQFIVITHNKKTVTGAKTLLGVTMEESGISKLITIRLDEESQKDA